MRSMERHAVTATDEKCFACGRALGRSPLMADTRDGQIVFVGRECFKQIEAAQHEGWQPPKGGPRLWLLETNGRKLEGSKLTIVYACRCEDLLHDTEYQARMCKECPPQMFVLCPVCREVRPTEEAALRCGAQHAKDKTD